MVNVTLARWRLDGRVTLRLPVKQFVGNEVILVHRRGRIILFGLLERDEKGVNL